MLRITMGLASLLLALPATGQDSSADYTRDYQRQALAIYRHVIGLRTAEGHGKVPEMANYLAGLFRDAGFSEDEVHVLAQRTLEGEEVASLVVQYRGNGLSGKKPVLFLAHMDVVVLQ